MSRKTQQGFTLIELAVVIVIIGVLSAIAMPGISMIQRDQRLKSAVRDVADSLMLARAQAVRTGNNHIVIFQGASGSDAPAQIRTGNIIDIVNDGVAASANCSIADGEVVYSTTPSGEGLSWGTTANLAANNAVPTDPGFATSNSSSGSSFSDATVSSATSTASKFASWVVFQPDGIPRLMTPSSCASLGESGQGGGAIYVTNGRRDYAIVLSPLGTVRTHNWIPGSGWTQ